MGLSVTPGRCYFSQQQRHSGNYHQKKERGRNGALPSLLQWLQQHGGTEPHSGPSGVSHWHEFTLLTPRHDDSAQGQQAGVWAGGQAVRAPGGGRRRLYAPSGGRIHLGFNLAEEIIIYLGLQPAKLLSQVSWS